MKRINTKKNMEIKSNNQILREATLGLKKNVFQINKEILDQQNLIEIIDLNSLENHQKLKKSENKFNLAIKNLRKDRRNLIIMILLVIVSLLFFII